MRIVSISFNPSTDNTRTTFFAEFGTTHNVTKLDSLSDAIYLLTEKYNSLLAARIEELK
jgi:hypothetical protein